MGFFGKIGKALSDIDPTKSDSALNKSLTNIDPTNRNSALREELRKLDPSIKLEELALPLAQAWKDEHPDAQPGSEADFNDCVLVVSAGMAAIGASMGGPVGAAIGAGGGIAAGRLVCRRVL
jgi:hypothetical protein